MTIPNPQKLNLPYKEWRQTQLDAFDWITKDNWLEVILIDKLETKFLEAPTGTGKTGIALGLAINYNLNTLILCATKIEQEQYRQQLSEIINSKFSDNPETYSKNPRITFLYGKQNYHCILPEEHSETDKSFCDDEDCKLRHVSDAKCQIGFDCPLKQQCEYFSNINSSFSADIVITNYAFGLRALQGLFNNRNPFDLIIEDEGHKLHQQLEEFVKLELHPTVLTKLGLTTYPDGNSKDKLFMWIQWAESVLPYMISELSNIRQHYGFYRGSTGTWTTEQILTVSELRNYQRYETYTLKLRQIIKLNKNWIVESLPKQPITFTPLWMSSEAIQLLWNKAPRHLIMSGTLPNPKELIRHTGLPPDALQFKRLPYTFPSENRSIIVNPVVKLTNKYINGPYKEQHLDRFVNMIDEILDDYPDAKGLIHTHSYKLTNVLVGESRHSMNMMTHTTKNRMKKLMEFKQSAGPRYLVSPSMEEAVDLPGDECEFIIIGKIPFPYLGSKIIKARKDSSIQWYFNETLTALIQMAGRGVRSEDDICPTYIVDHSAIRFLKMYLAKGNTTMSNDIKEAIVFEETEPWKIPLIGDEI